MADLNSERKSHWRSTPRMCEKNLARVVSKEDLQ